MNKNFSKMARVVTCASLIGASVLISAKADAADLANVQATPSDARPGITGVSYTFDVSNASANPTTTSCVTFAFSTSSGTGGSFPTGMNVAGVTLNTASSSLLTTPAGWAASQSANVVRVTNASPSTLAASTGQVTIGGITNSTTAGTYYVEIRTFTNSNCTGQVDYGQAALVITDATVASVDVDPTFTFAVEPRPAATSCAGSTSTAASTSTAVPFGQVIAGNFGVTVQNLRVGSNAAGGYKVYVRSTGVLTAPGGTIADFASNVPAAFPDPSTTPAFGYTSGDTNLATAFGAGQWAGNLATGAGPGKEVANGPAAAYSARNTCVGYRVNITESVASGTYVTNLIYTAVPTF